MNNFTARERSFHCTSMVILTIEKILKPEHFSLRISTHKRETTVIPLSINRYINGMYIIKFKIVTSFVPSSGNSLFVYEQIFKKSANQINHILYISGTLWSVPVTFSYVQTWVFLRNKFNNFSFTWTIN